MAERRDLDETDLAIIDLLASDARRSFREIGDEVDLSPPAVSDRVDRLREQGIIRRFTVDLDRSKVGARTPVLIELQVAPGTSERIADELADLDGVEHVFRTVDGRLIVHAGAPESGVGSWLRSELDLDGVRDYTVSLLEAVEWQPTLETAAFSIECVVCGNPVGPDGVTAEIGGEVKPFCCPSCEARYRERLEEHQSKAD